MELDVPQLSHVLEIERGHPHLLLRHGVLLVKVRFTLVDEEHRIGLAVKTWEIHLIELRRAVDVVAVVGVPSAD
jgi:hypothetical protein